MKKIVEITFIVIILLSGFYLVIRGAQIQQNRWNEGKEKEQKFIEDCLAKGRSIVQIGGPGVGYKLVCNP